MKRAALLRLLFLFLCLFFLFDNQLSAQIDSVKQQIRKRLNEEYNPDSILFYVEKMEQLEVTPRDQFFLNVTKGSANSQKGRNDLALDNYFKALSFATEQGLKATVYSNIAGVYLDLEDYLKATDYLLRADTIFINEGDKLRRGTNLITLGYTYWLQEDHDLSLQALDEAKYIFEDSTLSYHDYYWAYAEGNRSLTLASTGNLESAKDGLNNALNILEKYKDEYAISDYLIQYGKVLVFQNIADEAIDYLLEGLALAEKNEFINRIRDASQLLNQIYEQRQNFTKAYTYQTAYIQARDSLMNADLIRQLADQETKFQVSQKQVEVDLLEAEKKAREQFLIGMGIIVLLLIFGSLIVYRSLQMQRKLGRALNEQKTQLEQINNAKDKLFSIVSHDLRGPIIAFRGVANMIRMGVKNDDPEMLTEVAQEVKTSSIKLNDMLENLLSWAMQEQDLMQPKPEDIPLIDLFEELKGVYNQQAKVKRIELIFGDTGKLKVHADKNATATILRNLLNNAIKFTPEQGIIDLRASLNETRIKISIKDTGLGMAKEKVEALFNFQSGKASFGTAGEKGLGLGLNLVYNMVKANNGQIHVESKINEGTTFTVTLPSG